VSDFLENTISNPSYLANNSVSEQKCPALSVHNLSAGYPANRHAIDGLNFAVQRGERVAIVGPNGAGKSTLFKAIAGLIPFTNGKISVRGRDCRSSHALVGYVPQHNDIDWTFPATVFDVVMMGRAKHSKWFFWHPKRDYERVWSLLAQLKLEPFAHRPIGALSGGQRRRVFIARALAQETNILLMDEPFNGVDSTAEQELVETLEALGTHGITILLATHDLARAARDFDRVMLLKQHLLGYGTAAEVLRPSVLQQAYGGALRVFQEGSETLFVTDQHGAGD
jgi:ABC-type Mn2+/Zn2+ transport system ATPase subunit